MFEAHAQSKETYRMNVVYTVIIDIHSTTVLFVDNVCRTHPLQE